MTDISDDDGGVGDINEGDTKDGDTNDDNMDDGDDSDMNLLDDPNNQMGNLYQNEYPTQENTNPVQYNKTTERKQQINIFL